MKRRLMTLAAVAFLSVGAARANRGSIPFKPNVQIFEPTQRAMIAWNGIDQLVLTPRLVTQFLGIPLDKVELRHRPIAVTVQEPRGLNEEMDELLRHREDMKLRIWRIQGSLSAFDKDLIAR